MLISKDHIMITKFVSYDTILPSISHVLEGSLLTKTRAYQGTEINSHRVIARTMTDAPAMLLVTAFTSAS
jgi:hypothetical protein